MTFPLSLFCIVFFIWFCFFLVRIKTLFLFPDLIENLKMTKNPTCCTSADVCALWFSECRALVFFFFFFRQAQNCHILDPPLMMEGFLCCSSACHCEEKKKKNPTELSLLPPVLLFLMSRISFPVFGRTMKCSRGPLKCAHLLHKQRMK